MPTKSFKNKKKSIVAGSPAIEEHEAMMREVSNDQRYSDAARSELPQVPSAAVAQQPAKGAKPGSVFSQYQEEPTKNVQTRVSFETYARLNNIVLQAKMRKEKISIGEVVLQAINEYLERH